MKLTDYAKQIGVTYTTAYRWFKAGKLDAYQMDTGTIFVNDSDKGLMSKSYTPKLEYGTLFNVMTSGNFEFSSYDDFMQWKNQNEYFVLNELNEMGWELVSVIHTAMNSKDTTRVRYFYLKRIINKKDGT